MNALLECKQGRPDLHMLAGLGEELLDPARLRGWNLHDRLLGLNRHQRLVGDHMVALRHMPRHQLGLLEAFAEVRQAERAHMNARARRTAATMRSAFGI